MPAVPEHRLAAIDGAVQLDRLAEAERVVAQALAMLEEVLGPMANEVGWNRDYLVSRCITGNGKAVAAELAWSYRLGLTLRRNPGMTKAEAAELLRRGAAGYPMPTPNTSRSRSGRHEDQRPKRGKRTSK